MDRSDAAAASRVDRVGRCRSAGWEAGRFRLVAVDDEEFTPAARARGCVDRAGAAIDELAAIDPAGLEPADLRRLMEGVEGLRRRVEATAVEHAGHVRATAPFNGQGMLSAKATVKHIAGLSGPEAHRRLQVSRLFARCGDWERALAEGRVGVAQCELMAHVAADRGIADDVLDAHRAELLHDAITLPFDEFEALLRNWQGEADPAGDAERNDRNADQRDVQLRPRRGGGWTLSGRLPELEGAELNEILANFTHAEWQADWADARARVGDDATVADLSRTEPQRRADGMLNLARTAASTPPGVRAPAATINILIDEQTFEDRLTGRPTDPSRYRDIVCRTQAGRRVRADDVVNRALLDHVRRVVHDGAGTVIDLGRRSRLFRGAAREAVMLLATHCVWVGCDRPVHWCQADHTLGWRAHGNTVPRNGAPLCGTHNRLKERGYQVHRDAHGHWHIFGPDGCEVV